MKLTKTSAPLSLLALAALASPLATAADAGWYLGGNIGQARATIDETRIRSALLGAGFTTTSFAKDEREFGYKFFGGYQFNQYFALEGGNFSLGEFNFTAQTAPPGSLSGDFKFKGVNIDAVGILPLTENFSVFGRAGANRGEAKTSYRSTGTVTAPANRTERNTNPKFGMGLQYDFTESFGMRAEAERYRIDDAVGNDGDLDLFSVGMVYRFVSRKAAPVYTYTPPPAAKAPPPVTREVVMPPPVRVVVPVAKTVQYCSILDIQFEINNDEIQREEKERLAVVGTFLKKYPNTTAVIEGHTDDVGTDEENISLSQRRAESVVSYLVNTFQIAPSRLQAVGYGESRPLADNSTQEGQRANRRIGAVIACASDIDGLTVKPARVTMALDMEFDTQKADVRPQYREELRKVANYLNANPTVTATVEGHTGNLQATPELAMQMSQRRAQSVVNYLVDEFGVSRSRLSAEGFGQTRRFSYNTSLEGQQENRRVNIILNYPRSPSK